MSCPVRNRIRAVIDCNVTIVMRWSTAAPATVVSDSIRDS